MSFNRVMEITRRDLLKLLPFIALPIRGKSLDILNSQSMNKRAIPLTGEEIGIVGVGTWQTFDVGPNTEKRKELGEVLKILISMGGSVIDSSPMYGSSESTVGEISDELSINTKLFKATKVWITGENKGISQMNNSFEEMSTSQMDLMQIHNLVDWKTHIKTLYDWKEKGRIKYIGITHYLNSSHDQLERIIKDEKIDFIQVNYSINDRHAEKSLLPLANERGVAVLINRPYSGGSLFRAVKNTNLPDWAKDLNINSWGQFFLKYILGNEAVTCAIPGTGKASHMRDNASAGIGRMPTKTERDKMISFFSNI